ncbi:MAG: ribokinase [Planctomycetes bacterium]|nr:ribokinase [Planctomycetota bacterium]MBL7107652.1 ribokinase [Phycisphaerae bacterium]
MEANSPKVVVVGASYIDIAMKCPHMPVPAQTVKGSSFSCSVTGPGPNQATQAALCGCDVHLISKIGSDMFGDQIKKNLQKFNVNIETLFTAEAISTGARFTIVNNEGENATCTCCGANAALSVENIEDAEKFIAQANVCLIHGSLPHDTISRTIRLAKLNNTPVIINPSIPIDNSKDYKELPINFFADNIVVPNLYEAAQITEHSAANINTARIIGSELLEMGAKAAVITMGKKGSMVIDRNGADHIPAFEIELVDQTCTGDAFSGALAASYVAKQNIREATVFASAAGALACTKFGSVESLASRSEIIELLQSQEI